MRLCLLPYCLPASAPAALTPPRLLPSCSPQETFSGSDCSGTLDTLALGAAPFASEPRAGFVFDRLELPGVGDALSAAPGHGLSLVVEASFSVGGGADALPVWVTERPVLLVSGSPNPTYENATLRLVLQEVGAKASLEVEAGLVSGREGAALSDMVRQKSQHVLPQNALA